MLDFDYTTIAKGSNAAVKVANETARREEPPGAAQLHEAARAAALPIPSLQINLNLLVQIIGIKMPCNILHGKCNNVINNMFLIAGVKMEPHFIIKHYKFIQTLKISLTYSDFLRLALPAV